MSEPAIDPAVGAEQDPRTGTVEGVCWASLDRRMTIAKIDIVRGGISDRGAASRSRPNAVVLLLLRRPDPRLNNPTDPSPPHAPRIDVRRWFRAKFPESDVCHVVVYGDRR